jgi:hypothetical protein
MTAQGISASLSPAIGRSLAQWYGYGTAFLILGGFALGSVLIWLRWAAILKVAVSAPRRRTRGLTTWRSQHRIVIIDKHADRRNRAYRSGTKSRDHAEAIVRERVASIMLSNVCSEELV